MANKRIDYVIGFNADTGKLSNALKQLEAQLNNIAIGKNMPAGTLTTQIQQASKAALELNSYLNKSINVDTGKLDLSAFSKALTLGKTDLQTLRANLIQIGPAGQEAFASLARAIGQAEMPLRRSNELIDKLWITMKNTVRWQITSGLLTGFTGAIGDAYRYAEDLNESLNNIRIVTGKSAEDMAQFAKQANKAAKELNTTTNKYAQGSLIYFQQGLNDKEVKERTDVTAKFANVSRESLTTSSEYLTAIWNNFAKGSENLEYFADVIVALGAATASSSQEIATGLNRFAATAETVGLSYEYATAALATVTATTRQSAEVVGTAFKTLFSRIQDLELGKTLDDGTTLGKYSKALAAVGVSIKDSNGELRDMDRILDDIGGKWDTLNKDEQVALAQAVGGIRQYTQFIALMDNWDFMKENLETAKGATGELQKQADIFAESWEAARKNVKASAEGIYDSLVKDEFWIDLTNGFAGFLKIIESAIDSVGGLKGVLLGLAIILQKQFGERFRNGLRETAYQLSYLVGGGQKQRKEAMSLKGAAGDALKGSVYGDTNVKVQTKITQDIIGFQTKIDSIYDKLTDDQKRSLDLQIALVENTQKLALEQNRVAMAAKKTAENYGDIVADSIVEREDFDINSYTLSAAKIGRMRRAQRANPLTDEDIRREAAFEFRNFNRQDPQDILRQYITQVREGASIGRVISSLRNEKNSYSRKDLLSIWDALGIDDGYKADIENQSDADFRKELINRLQEESSRRAADAQDRLNYIRQVFQFDGRDDKNQTRFNDLLEGLRDRARNAGTEEAQSFWDAIMAQRAGEDATPEPPSPDWADRLTSIGDAATKAGFAYSAFVGVVNSLQDDSLSPVEKLQALIFGLSSGLPAAISGFKSLKTIFETGGLVGKGILGLGAGGSAAIVVAAIAAVSLGIYALAEAIETTAEKTKHFQEQQEQLKTQYDEARNSITELKSSFKELDDLGDTLKSLTQGTEEWQQSLQDINFQVLQLIEKYPELAGEVENINGKLTISAAGQERFIEAQQNRANDLAKGYYAATMAKNRQDYENAITDFRADRLENSGKFVAPEAVVKKVVQEVANGNSAILDDRDALSNLLGGMASGEVLDFIQENTTELKNLAVKLQANTESQSLLAAQFVEANFGEEANELSTGLSKLYASNEEQYVNQARKNGINELSKQEVIDWYGENVLGGANGKKTGFLGLGDSAEFYDSEGKSLGTFSYEAMREAMASQQGMEDFSKIVEPFIEKYKNLDKTLLNTILGLSSGDVDINELDQETFQQLKSLWGDKLVSMLNELGVNGAQVIADYNEKDLLGQWNETYHNRIEYLGSDLGKALNARDDYLKQLSEYDKDQYNAIKLKVELEGPESLSDDEKQILADVNRIVDNLSENADKIKLSINSSLRQDVDEAFDIGRDFDILQDKIANGLEMTTDEVVDLIDSGYGALLQNCEATSEGLISLNQDVVDAFVTSKKEEIEADKQAKIAQLKTQREWLVIQKEALEKELDLLDAAANEKDGERAAELLANAMMQQAIADDAAEQAAAVVGVDAKKAEALTGNAKEVADYINSTLDATTNTAIDDNFAIATSTYELQKNIIEYWQNMAKARSNYFSINDDNPNGNNTKVAIANAPKPKGSAKSSEPIEAFDSSKLKDEKAMQEQVDKWANDIYEKAQHRAEEINKAAEALKGNARKELDLVLSQIGSIDAAIGRLNGNIIDSVVGGKGDSGSSKEAKDTAEALKEVLERYHEITREIEYQKDLLDDISNMADRAYGTDKVELLTQKIDKLNKVAELQKEKQAAAAAYVLSDLEAIRAAGMAVSYDTASYELKNYTDLLNQITDEYNSRINSVSDENRDAVQKEYDDKMKLLENYEESIDTFRDELNEYQDTMREIEDTKLDRIQAVIQIKLDWKQFQDTLREFAKEVNESVGDALDQALQATTLNKQGAQDELAMFDAYEAKMNALLDAVRNANEYTDVASLQEDLASMREDLADSASALLDYVATLKNVLPDALEAASERFNEFIGVLENGQQTLEAINTLANLQSINYSMADKYALLGKSYSAALENAFTQAKLQKQYTDRAAKELEEAETALAAATQGTAEYDILKANRDALLNEFNTAQSAMLSATQQAMEAAKSIYSNALDEIFYEFEQKMSKGMGYDLLQSKYTRTKEEDDRFLDGVNRFVETQTLNNKLQQSINAATSDYAKSTLKALEEEFAQRQSNTDLSEYDLKIMEAKYNMTLKQIALEEAQNAKSKVRLVRGANGNYNYLFTADNNDINQKQQEYLKAMQDYYNIAKQQTENITGEIVSLWKDMSNEIRKIYEDDSLDADQRQSAINEIQAYYQKKYEDLIKMQKDAAKDMNDAGNSALTEEQKIANRYGDETSEVAEMFKENFKRILEEMGGDAENFNSDYSDTLLNLVALEGSFTEITSAMFSKLNDALNKYKGNISNISNEIGVSYDELTRHVDMVSAANDTLKEKATGAIEEIWNKIDEIQDVTQAQAGWTSEIYKTITAMQRLAAETATAVQRYNEAISNIQSLAATGSYMADSLNSAASNMNNTSGGGYTPSSPKKPQETPVNKTRVREQLGQFPYDSQIYKSLTQNGAVYEGGGWWNFYPENRSRLKTIIATTKNGNKGKSFATGGYTGEWSNGDTEGRVAMLHQKELVLNKTDTENMLAAVQAIRDFSPELIASIRAKLSAVSLASQSLMGSRLASGSPDFSKEPTELAQNVNINADFPGVRDAIEIKEALESLVQTSAQRINFYTK